MPSPFPGMNPYLEQSDAWEDFHHRFITHAADLLGEQVGPNYLVKDVERRASLEIRDRRSRRVVTVIELLSPTNKAPGINRDEYLNKRSVIFVGHTHLVEIDLRRGGERPQPPTLPRCDYYAPVSRIEDRPTLGVWPVGLRERLPVIPIPLTAPDADVALDLQGVLHRVYDAGQYRKYIYEGSPEPLLSAEDASWARQFLPPSDL